MLNVNSYLNNEVVTVLTKKEMKAVQKEIKRQAKEEIKLAKKMIKLGKKLMKQGEKINKIIEKTEARIEKLEDACKYDQADSYALKQAVKIKKEVSKTKTLLENKILKEVLSADPDYLELINNLNKIEDLDFNGIKEEFNILSFI